VVVEFLFASHEVEKVGNDPLCNVLPAFVLATYVIFNCTLLAVTALAPLAAGAEPMQATAEICFVNPMKSPPERQRGERVSPPPLQPFVMFRDYVVLIRSPSRASV
jgi:hypothetical protein